MGIGNRPDGCLPNNGGSVASLALAPLLVDNLGNALLAGNGNGTVGVVDGSDQPDAGARS